MIRMRVIIPDDSKAAASSVVVSLLGLLWSNKVPSFLRILTFVFSGIDFVENVGLAFAASQKKTAAFVWIGAFAVSSDFSKLA